MTLNIDQFKARLAQGGARPNLFRVMINFPQGISNETLLAETSFLCKGASLPPSTITEIEVPYRGRKIYIAGDREYEPWSTTFINDNNFRIRDAFEEWINIINDGVENIGLTDPSAYQVDMEVEQLNKAGDPVKRYIMRNAWPMSVSAIDLSNDSQGEIEEFEVEFRYDRWDPQSITQAAQGPQAAGI